MGSRFYHRLMGGMVPAACCFLSIFVPVEVGSQTHNDAPEASVLVARLGCLYQCPEYRVEIRGDGSIVWEGSANVAVKGAAESHMEGSTARKLFAEVFTDRRSSICSLAQGLDGEFSALIFSADGISAENRKMISSARSLSEAGSKNCYVSTNVKDALATIERGANSHRWMHGLESILEDTKVWEDATYMTKPGFTELMSIAALGDSAKLANQVKLGNVNSADETGWTALMVAASQCETDAVDTLLKNEADPNSADQQHQTALMAAASSRCFRTSGARAESEARRTLTESLMRAGARVNAQDEKGQTALAIAVRFANPEATKTLLAAGADASITDHDGLTPLMRAKKYQQLVHETYSRRYWARYERNYREIIDNLLQAERSKHSG
jgi:ankyrin repeat protein